MKAYAVVETGGKQYRLHEGDEFAVERLKADVGETIQLGRVLAMSDGEELTVGAPEVDGASVTAEIISHPRGPKLIVFKQKRRKGYRRKAGHRQELTVVKVQSLGAAGEAAPQSTPEPETAPELAPVEPTTDQTGGENVTS